MRVSPAGQQVALSYRDGGSFGGDPRRLGSLFYKFDSPKGSGIGLYLVKKLVRKMRGRFSIRTSPLSFEIRLPRAQGGPRA